MRVMSVKIAPVIVLNVTLLQMPLSVHLATQITIKAVVVHKNFLASPTVLLPLIHIQILRLKLVLLVEILTVKHVLKMMILMENVQYVKL